MIRARVLFEIRQTVALTISISSLVPSVTPTSDLNNFLPFHVPSQLLGCRMVLYHKLLYIWSSVFNNLESLGIMSHFHFLIFNYYLWAVIIPLFTVLKAVILAYLPTQYLVYLIMPPLLALPERLKFYIRKLDKRVLLPVSRIFYIWERFFPYQCDV